MKHSNVGCALLVTWLVTAAWDAVCASALSIFAYHSTFSRLWRGIHRRWAECAGIRRQGRGYPLATGRPPSFGFRRWVQVVAHVPFVTLPLVFTARRALNPIRP